MSQNETNEESQDNHEQLSHNLDVRNLETNSAANSLTRRSSSVVPVHPRWPWRLRASVCPRC